VNDINGLLLSANPSPLEIAEAIFKVFSEKENWDKKRMYSRRNWEKKFNAEKNYNAFSVELLLLV
jgi:hypothetical protein